MCKIGILTFHFAENVGASLQCVSLYKYLSEQGADVSIINYMPKYHTAGYKVFVNPFSDININSGLFKCFSIILKRLFVNFKFIFKLKKKLGFKTFMYKHIKVTKYAETISELSQICEGFDVCIVGSDQIWNKRYTNNKFDAAYFLKFYQGKKYSYAASAGYLLSKAELNDIKQYIEDFTLVSVREESLKKQLTEIGLKNVITCVDPALLLTKKQWERLFCERMQSKYIVIYELEYNKSLQEIVMELVKRTNYHVINISPKVFWKDKRIKMNRKRYCTPTQFLEIMSGAEYVITNSFHGTVLSIIFEKKFATILHSKTPERVQSLLEMCDLQCREYKCFDESIFNEIKYDFVKNKIEIEIEKSKDFLNKIIEGLSL